MKRLVLAIAVVGAMAMTPAAVAAGKLSPGTYRIDISNTHLLGGSLFGIWSIQFVPHSYYGYFVVHQNEQVVEGKDSIKGNKITFHDKSGTGACPGTGKYKFKLSGKKLTFTLISDPKPACIGRKDVLTYGVFKKVG
jgi:hypothetical protein